MLLQRALTRALDFLFWTAFGLFILGGIRINGALRLSHIHDLWVICAVAYGLLRISGVVRFRDLSFGRSFHLLAEAVIAAARTRQLAPLKQLRALSWIQLGAIAYCLGLFVYLPVRAYWNFANFVFDLGIIENAVYNASQTGKFFTYFLMQGDQPTYYLPHNRLNLGLGFFALLYRGSPHAEWLLILQSLALLAALIPLYKLSDLILPREIPRWMPMLAYVLWDPIHRMNLWDIHEAPFSIPFALWAFYFIEKKRIAPAAVFLILMSIWREDLWWSSAAACLYAGIRMGRWRVWAPLAIGMAAIFPMHVSLLNEVNSVGHRYPYLGPDLKSAVLTTLTRPWVFIQIAWENWEFFLTLILTSGGAVFALGGAALLPMVAPLAEVGLSQHEGMLNWANHYVGQFAAPMFFASLHGWAWLYPRLHQIRPGLGQAALGCSLALCLSQLNYSEPGALRKGVRTPEETRCLEEIVAMIPPRAPVIATDPVASHLSRRAWISLPDPTQDQSQAEWLITPKPEHLNTIGNGSWKPVAQKCGLWIANRL